MRFVSLLVFNVVVLLIIGFLTPARVGWAALWAGIVLTALSIWIKPLIHKWFTSMAAKSAHRRTKAGEKVIEFFLAFVVAFLVWMGTVWLSGVSIGGSFFGAFWGYVLPPVILLIGWAIYDAIDDRVEAHADVLYGKASRGRTTSTPDAGAPAIPTPEGAAGRRELHDGLTEEQRRMLDELGKS